MNPVHQWGIDLILHLQAHRGPYLDALFRGISALGGPVRVALLPFVLWALSYRAGSRLLVTLLFSALGNFSLKEWLAQPRPFDLDPRIGPDRSVSPGMPSGHAQHSLVEWTLIAYRVSRPWFSWLAIGLVVLIGFSRIWLGLHFPTDVLGGWAVGALILWFYFRFADRIAPVLSGLTTLAQCAIASAASLPFVLAQLLSDDRRYILGLGGLLLGAACGMALYHRWQLRCEGGTLAQRALRYLLGMAVLCLWIGVAGVALKALHGTLHSVADYAVNAVAGLWLTAVAPLVFGRLGLLPVRLQPGGGEA